MAEKKPPRLDRVGLEKLTQVSEQATAPAMKAISEAMRAAPALDALRDMMQKMTPTQEVLAALAQRVNETAQATPSTFESIQMPKPREAYILEAQYDTIKAIESMGQQSLAVMNKQIEVLEDLQKETDEQTKLTRRVLAVAIAGIVIACVSLVVSLVA